jgi:integrase/recombinase XerD
MTPESLRLHIDAYLELRRSLGFRTVRVVAHDLRGLLDYVIAQGFSWPIRTQAILDWINAASIDCGLGGQRLRLINARCFLKHLKASAPETEVPGPGLLPRQPRPKPRLYSVEEIAKLQQATSELWEPGSLWQLTPYSIIGLLASTGLRAGEVIALTVGDVHLDSDPPQLYIRKTKFYKSGSCLSIPARQNGCGRICKNAIGPRCAGHRQRSSLPEGAAPFPIPHSATCLSS